MDAVYRFADPLEALDTGTGAIILDMHSADDRATCATIMERLSFPTIRHARGEVFNCQFALLNARAELRRLLNLPNSTHPLDRMVQKPGWQWRAAREQCRRIRANRRSLRGAQARVARYLAEDLAAAFETEAASINNKQKAA
jgi:hypothetical protein